MSQTIIVYIIGGLLAVYIVWRLIRRLSGKRRAVDPCAGCTGCDLRGDYLKKQQECAEKGVPEDKRLSGSVSPHNKNRPGKQGGYGGCGCGA